MQQDKTNTHLNIPRHKTSGSVAFTSPFTLAVQPLSPATLCSKHEDTICNHKNVNSHTTGEPCVTCLLFSFMRTFPDMPPDFVISLNRAEIWTENKRTPKELLKLVIKRKTKINP
jgi:hypothetical protein